MKKQILAVTMAAAMVVGVVGCGGSSSSSTSSKGSSESASSSKDDAKTIRLVNGKIEVDKQLKELAAAYKKKTGITVKIESMGGGVDIQGTLKGYYQADNMPDIFVCGGASDFSNWTGKLADMSDADWVKNTEEAYKDEDGKVIGFPYTTEAIGLTYNADILEKAGVDPKSITSPAAMEEAFKTIDAKKDELGLTAVVGYCAESKDLYWSTGNHLFAAYEDEGLARDDSKYFDMLNDGGKIDEKRFTNFAKMIGLFNKYSDPDLLVSGTYDQQILNFASGKYAFVTQGSWIGSTMTNDDAKQYKAAGSFKVGMVPFAFEDGQDTILTNAPSWWAVYDNDKAQMSKDFLAWCAGDEGQEILVKKAGFISPFTDCKYVADDPFAQTIVDYQQAGKTSGWHWLGNKEGLAQNALGVVFQDYASGSIASPEDFTKAIAQVTEQYYAQ